MAKYKAYPEYKDSGSSNIGGIPTHWELKKLKYLTKCLDGSRIPLNATQRGEMQGVIPYWGANSIVDYVNAYLFDEELVLLGEDGAPFFDKNKDVAFHITGKIWPNNHVHVLRPKLDLTNAKFLAYAINCTDFSLHISGSTRDKLNQSDMDNINIRYCDRNEQDKISFFLDHETAKIDNLIEKQQQLIELLKEKRQAVISHAVTKGLNPDVPMKDSGVEWLGVVPEHWRINSLNHVLAAIGDVDHYMPQSVDDGIPYVMTGDLTEFVSGIEFSKCKQVNLRDYLKLSKKIKTCLGDVIMARYATIGTVSYVDIDKDFLVSYSCVTIKPNPSKVLGLYLYYYFKSNSFLQGIQYQVNTNTQGNVGINDLSKMKIVLPSIKEQEEIIAHLQMNLEQLDDLSTKSTQAINLIQERRSALISAAVTGKIDVRDWVAPDMQNIEASQEDIA